MMKGTVLTVAVFVLGCIAGWSGFADMEMFGDAGRDLPNPSVTVPTNVRLWRPPSREPTTYGPDSPPKPGTSTITETPSNPSDHTSPSM